MKEPKIVFQRGDYSEVVMAETDPAKLLPQTTPEDERQIREMRLRKALARATWRPSH